MSNRYPSVRIRPVDVIKFSQQQGQQPSIEDAERWLSSQRRRIEEMMSNLVRGNLEEILGQATSWGYPDPVFDKQFTEIDEAILNASDELGEKMNKEFHRSSCEVRDLHEVVRRMLAQQDKFVACIAYLHEFETRDESYEERVITHRTKRVHLTCESGKVKAELVVEDACEHGPDVFMP